MAADAVVAGPEKKAKVGYRSLFALRDYRLLFAGLITSQSGSWAYNVALIVYVFNVTHSPAWVAGASMARFLSALLSSAFGGVVADRVERVRLMVTLDIVATIVQAGLAVAAAFSAPALLVIALATLTSVSTASYDPTARATIPTIVGEEHLAAANSVQAAIENLTIIVGPAIGALLLVLGPPPLVFAINAATFAFSALVVSRMRVRSAPADVTEGGRLGPLQQMGVGIRAFFSSSTVVVLAGFSIVASFMYGTDTVLFIVLSKQQLGTGSQGYGYLLAALGVGGLIVAPFMNRIAGMRRLGTIIVAGLLVYGLPTALLSIVHSPVIAFALEAIRGGGTIVVDVLAITALQRSVSPDVVARVFGVFFALVLAAISLGALLMPIFLGAFGLTTTLLIVGLGIPALTLLSYPKVRQIDRRAVGRLAAIEPRIAILERLDILAGAARPTLERLALSAVEETVAARRVIIEEGADPDDFFVLVDGEAEVISVGEAGVPRMLGSLTPPNYFGEIGLLGRRPRTATVRTVTPCTLLRIRGDDFVDALTTASLSPSALGSARFRLARTHPSLSLDLAPAAPGDAGEETSAPPQ
ncbi:MAG TPA: MFS transporter [Candidatus Dormibacteraeota bacterium]|nr:MFS transporter [Candidatus Dormibacteraeota bacterium]